MIIALALSWESPGSHFKALKWLVESSYFFLWHLPDKSYNQTGWFDWVRGGPLGREGVRGYASLRAPKSVIA